MLQKKNLRSQIQDGRNFPVQHEPYKYMEYLVYTYINIQEYITQKQKEQAQRRAAVDCSRHNRQRGIF